MKISSDTQEVIGFIENISGGSLPKSADLALILEIGASFGLHEKVSGLIFSGSAINNLSSIIINNKEPEGKDKINEQMATEIKIFSGLLQSIADYMDEGDKISITDSYLKPIPDNFDNILSFASTLAMLKKVQTELKSRKLD